ncbi:hypothetical protein FHG87_019981, partial [Trinorchestia longiramus]
GKSGTFWSISFGNTAFWQLCCGLPSANATGCLWETILSPVMLADHL